MSIIFKIQLVLYFSLSFYPFADWKAVHLWILQMNLLLIKRSVPSMGIYSCAIFSTATLCITFESCCSYAIIAVDV